ncbi:DUF805 domain-containing protein [Rhizobium lentis]|uniref:DUF805 domain-containing protein n=1 Tax=Rhizobium lentis TaxID=1138194 RepID=A0ABS7IH12_9HYPH|nr:DUF805 domain-containing protein [Rhizobium lentis]MBX4956077.1 DUF805 domain-containing protein [Rhizobium lentis]MBX4974269.1 DUF805 domain-containing protein [Rhizobium lentis]MBX4985354.1 DUF805 domain-containing protein [Rhizobium lentis]MBX4997123.1 DUF805 domain-containing protein [Rhizobium lentis]MBX5018501.1 DUF805 domain-containing protein [Rhizobium lentis]
MGFTEAVRTVLKKYVAFSGRASRSEYWWFALFYVLALFPLAILAFALAILFSGGLGAASPIHYTVVIWMVFTLAVLLPLISLQIRRFHDRNISGWWFLALFILSFVPYVVLVTFPVIIVISMLPGTEGPNKFGADPLRPELSAVAFA